MKTRALLLLGHADPDSFNAGLARAYADGWEESGGDHQLVELGSLAFDPVLRGGHRAPQALEPDLVDLRESFERAAHVAWFFPVYWGSPPALVRGLVDRLFLPGWAFQYSGGSLPDGLLRGRSSRVVSTMDSPGWWYALAHRWALHATMGTGTLRFCGFDPVEFTLLHGVREMKVEVRERWLGRMRELGRSDGRRRAADRAVAEPAQLGVSGRAALPARVSGGSSGPGGSP